MNFLLFIIGCFLLLIVISDFFFTTLSFKGYGYLSQFLYKYIARVIIKKEALHPYSGLIHLLVNGLVWLIFMVIGAGFLFCLHQEMVIYSSTKLPAPFFDRFYFTSYMLSTLGNGDLQPGTGFSKFIFAGLSFSGFIMLTLLISYLSSVISAVKKQRLLALKIYNMGNTFLELHQAIQVNADEWQSIYTTLIENFINLNSYPLSHRFIAPNKYCHILQSIRLYQAILEFLKTHPTDDLPPVCQKIYSTLKLYFQNEKLLIYPTPHTTTLTTQLLKNILYAVGKNGKLVPLNNS